MNLTAAIIVLLLLLIGPLAIAPIEHNLEMFILAIGILATFLAGGPRSEVIHSALTEPVMITIAVIVAALIFRAARARLDLMKFYEWIGECDGLVTYDTRDLFEFLLREIPIAGAREWQQESSKAMVCSGFVTSTLIKSGVLSPGINWTQWGPQQLVECGIYKACVPLLGNPTLTRFNTLTA